MNRQENVFNSVFCFYDLLALKSVSLHVPHVPFPNVTTHRSQKTKPRFMYEGGGGKGLIYPQQTAIGSRAI